MIGSHRNLKPRHSGATAIAVIALIALSAGAALEAQAAPSFTAPSYDMTIGQPGAAFVYPWGMAYDPTTGTILTSDYNNYQVRRFTTAGAPDGVYGSRAQLNGQQPYAVAVDPSTGDFVVDDLEGYDRYTSTGTLVELGEHCGLPRVLRAVDRPQPPERHRVRGPVDRPRRLGLQRDPDVQ